MKKLMMVVVTGLTVLTAKADYSSVNQYLGWYVANSDVDFTYAVLMSTLNGGEAIYQWDMPGVTEVYAPDGNKRTTEWSSGTLPGDTDYSSTKFFVKVYDDEDKVLGSSVQIAYSDLVDYIYQDMLVPKDTYGFIVSSPVPEPTSGMLFLLGLAGLALRRRRVVDGSGSCTKEM